MISTQVDSRPPSAPRQVLNVDGDPVAPEPRKPGCGAVGIIAAVVVIALFGVGIYFLVTHFMGAGANASAAGAGKAPAADKGGKKSQ